MCRQGRFYIFNQAPSFNLQKLIQRHIKEIKWCLTPIGASNISFLPLEKVHFLQTTMLGMAMPGTAMSCTPMSCMLASSIMSCTRMLFIVCFMSELTATCQLTLNTQTGLTAACQLKCFKISPTAKIGMSLKINSVMPPTAKG
jgi:hypothetical protein